MPTPKMQMKWTVSTSHMMDNVRIKHSIQCPPPTLPRRLNKPDGRAITLPELMDHPDYPFIDFDDNEDGDEDAEVEPTWFGGRVESVKPPQSNRRELRAGGGESVKPPQSNRRKELISD